MRIKFLSRREVQDGKQNTKDAEIYHEGDEVDLSQASAEHWISRKVAVRMDERQERERGIKVEEMKEKEEVEEIKTPTTTARPLVAAVSVPSSTVSGAGASVPEKETTVSGAMSASSPKK